MSAGLPGLGLGGLFFIFSALLAPFPELWRTLRGRSDLARWRTIGRQLAQALAMVAAIDLTLRLAYVVLSAAGVGDPPAADEATVLPLNLIGITTALLVLVLCGAKLAELALRARGGELPRVPEALPRVAPLRAATLGAAAAVAWIALLVAGASELSPLERPQREQATGTEQDAGAAPQPAVAKPRGQAQDDLSSAPAPTGTPAEAPSGAAGPDGDGGRTGAAPSPAVATTETPPPKPADPAPVTGPEPKGPPVDAPAPPPQAAGGGPPESAGPPEGVPAPEAAAPPAEPPPQAPAKGLRE